MRNRLIILILLLTIINCPFINSQLVNGRVTYEVNMENFIKTLEDNEKTSSFQKNLFKQVADKMLLIELELVFDKNISIFKILKSMPIGNKDPSYQLALSFSSKGIYYTDLDRMIQILATKFQEEESNVLMNVDKVLWELTDETKKIESFICYKATLKKIVPDGDKEIIAWYAPSIPVQYGPKDYVGNLPGLILELDDLLVSYKARNIDINVKDRIEIEWPKTFNTMSSEEYEKKGKEFYEKVKNNGL